MITDDDGVKILDFGIAKHLYAATIMDEGSEGTTTQPSKSGITQTGDLLGTPSYASPEQVQGEEVDHLTDIWSFGIMLYEMVTRQLPFEGQDKQGMIDDVLNKAPVPLTSLRSDVSLALERIIDKCLEKEKVQRYQSAEAF